MKMKHETQTSCVSVWLGNLAIGIKCVFYYTRIPGKLASKERSEKHVTFTINSGIIDQNRDLVTHIHNYVYTV